MILADALVASPLGAGFHGLEEELNRLIDREREHLWPAKPGSANRPIGSIEADVAITFATMVDGLGENELKAIARARGAEFARSILSDCARAIGKPLSRTAPCLGGLEPDLIGEFFVLEALAEDHENPFLPPQHAWMVEAAWRTRGRAMLDFVTRASQNFPHHTTIPKLATIVEGVTETWVLLARATFENSDEPMARFSALWPILRDAAAADVGAATVLFELTTVFIHLPSFPDLVRSEAMEPTLLRTFLYELEGVLAAHPDEPALREEWNSSVIGFIANHAAEDAVGCRALLDDLKELQAAYPGEPTLREGWAASVFNLITGRAREDAVGCRALLDDVRELHAAHPTEPALRKCWALSVLNFIGGCAATDPSGCGICLRSWNSYASHIQRSAYCAGRGRVCARTP